MWKMPSNIRLNHHLKTKNERTRSLLHVSIVLITHHTLTTLTRHRDTTVPLWKWDDRVTRIRFSVKTNTSKLEVLLLSIISDVCLKHRDPGIRAVRLLFWCYVMEDMSDRIHAHGKDQTCLSRARDYYSITVRSLLANHSPQLSPGYWYYWTNNIRSS